MKYRNNSAIHRSGSSKLHTRIFVPFVALVVTSIVITGTFTSSRLSQLLEQRLHDKMLDAATVLEGSTLPLTGTLLELVSAMISTEILLFDQHGQLAYTSSTELSDPFIDSIRNAINETASLKAVNNPRTLEIENRRYQVLIKPLDLPKDPRYKTLVLWNGLIDINRTLQVNHLLLIGMTALTCLFVIVMGYRIARSIARPVEALTKQMTETAELQPISPEGPLEVQQLAEAFNQMSKHIHDYESQLVESSRLAAMGEMSARMAHEIRNPLTAIRMQIQMLGMHLSTDSKERQQLVLKELDRLELIVASTLVGSQQNSELNLQKVSVNRLVTELTALISDQFKHGGIDISLKLDANLPEISLDSDKLKQVLLNLLVNARDELAGGGKIQISTGSTNTDKGAASIYISIADSGPGIPKEERETLFKKGVSRKKAGLGLGLDLCNQLIKAHGGTIAPDHSPLGGACFTIHLPTYT
ncbi:MAG: HAMP domain-containing protein [Pseudomonadales bacterium]|nr:HAMP domain-containing protein [Pseudomonadales bacterium]